MQAGSLPTLTMQDNELIKIDLRQVLKQKMGAKARYVPSWAVSWLERTICQDELNNILERLHPRTGADFCDGLFDYLNARITVTNPEAFPPMERRRLIIVSNHPLGGLDGMAIIAELTRRFGTGLRFVVNDLLMAVKPLGDVFLPINKHGRQDRQAIADINEVMASEHPVVIFPAGLVSRRQKGGVSDLQWHKMFVNKAVEYQRDVLPIFFSGENSSFFYKFAQWRERLGLKFNIEMIYLPSEMLRCRDREFAITVGEVIPWQQLRNGPEALAQAQEIKQRVYALKSKT